MILCRFLFTVALLLLLAASPAPAQEAAPGLTLPEQKLLEANIKKTHPRLLVTPEDFTRVKKLVKENDLARRWYDRLAFETRKIMTEPVSRYQTRGREANILDISRTVLRRVYLLALLQKVEGGNRYAHRLWQELDAAARFADWRPEHFLDTAEMTHAFAVAFDWLYDIWSPEQRAVLSAAIRDKGLKPALQAYRGEKFGWWVKTPYNWNQVCNGGIGLGALAVFEDAPELAAAALQGACRSLPPALAKFAPDGGCYEGPLYWGFATYYHTLFLAALETATGRGFGLAETPGYGATGFFPLYVTGPQRLPFNYADAGDHLPWTSHLFWLARKFGQPVFAAFARRPHRVHPLDLLWFVPEGPGPQEANLPLDRYFRGVEVATFRSSWNDPQALFLGFKGGDNDAGHAHLDLGAFVLEAQGVRWALDLGADSYDLPGYFDQGRWEYYRCRAEGHNTLVLNPGSEPDQDLKATASITRFRSESGRSLAVADLTAAYRGRAQRVWRGVSLLERRRVLVQDEVQADKPVEVCWAMHTQAEVQLSPDKRTATLSQGKSRLEARIISPPEAGFSVLPARPAPLSPRPRDQAVNTGVSKLAIQLVDIKDLSLAVLLTPVSGEESRPLPALEGQITPLAQW
jgi:hypothetical protein